MLAYISLSSSWFILQIFYRFSKNIDTILFIGKSWPFTWIFGVEEFEKAVGEVGNSLYPSPFVRNSHSFSLIILYSCISKSICFGDAKYGTSVSSSKLACSSSKNLTLESYIVDLARLCRSVIVMLVMLALKPDYCSWRWLTFDLDLIW